MTQNEIDRADARLESLAGSFEPPNLDCLSTDPDDYAAMERVLDCLSLYASAKRHAMVFRLAGDIDAAIAYERQLDRYYARLPQWARW